MPARTTVANASCADRTPRGHLPTVRLIFVPAGRCVPAAALVLRTRPRCVRLALRFLTLPTAQCAFVIARRASASFMPLTFGTTHRVRGRVVAGAGTGTKGAGIAADDVA